MFVRGSIYLEWSKGGHGTNNAREERESSRSSSDGVRRKAVGKVFCFGVGCEKKKISDFETKVEIFGLNWQLIQLAS